MKLVLITMVYLTWF